MLFFFFNSESIWHLRRKNFSKVQSLPPLEKDPVVGPPQDSRKVSWDPHPSALECCIRDCTFRLKGQRLALSTERCFLWGLQAPPWGRKSMVTCAHACSVSPTLYDPWHRSRPRSSVRGTPGKILEGLLFLLQGIFLTQGSNPCLLSLRHWQADSLSTPVPPGTCS